MSLERGTIEYPGLGCIAVTRNSRARRITMRCRDGRIFMTVPECATAADISRALAQCGDKLKAMQEKSTPQIIDKEFSITTERFSLRIRENSTNCTTVTGKDGAYIIECPLSSDYSNGYVQEGLRRCIKGALRHCAKSYLPKRLHELAMKYGFRYSRCSVRDVHSRWGSCSTRGDISLSIYMMMLPGRLVDYVLLHELCHTVEMNHDTAFWELLDKCTAPACAKELRKELKGYNCRI